jgi:hypothetical protein
MFKPLTFLLFTTALLLVCLYSPRQQVQSIDDERRFLVLVNGKYGFINRRGVSVIKPMFDNAQQFSEGLALVTLKGKKIFIDLTGKVVLEPKDFEPINGFTDGLARGNITTSSPYKKGYINKAGKLAFDIPNSWGACLFSEGLACVETKKWGFINTSGQFVITPQFDEAAPFSEGFASVTFWDKSKTSRHKNGYIDKSGRLVIKPQFDITQPFSEGLAAVGYTRGDDYRFGFIIKLAPRLLKLSSIGHMDFTRD